MNRKAFERWRLWLGAAVLVWAVGGADPEGARAEAASRIRDHLYAAYLLSPDEAWVVGSFGAIYHTKDGGKQGEKRDGGVIEPLNAGRLVWRDEGESSGNVGWALQA